MRSCPFALVAGLLVAASASAQTERPWLVLPVDVEGQVELDEQLAKRVQELLAARGADAIELTTAARSFETQVSAPPATLSEQSVEQWQRLSDGAVRDLAKEDYSQALAKLEPALSRSKEAVEELNRDPARARRVLDTCLYMVRAVLARDDDEVALRAARDCRRLVPRAEPSPYMHPPAVTKVLTEIDAQQVRQTGGLRIDSVPSGCSARINGVLLGDTPVAFDGLFPGAYRVQVECDAGTRGRIHSVTIGAGRLERVVNARFDAAVVSRPILRLAYERRGDAEAERFTDARSVSRGATTGTIVLMSKPDPDTLLLERIGSVSDGVADPVAFAQLGHGPHGVSNSALKKGVDALVDGRCVDLTRRRAEELTCPGATEATVGGETLEEATVAEVPVAEASVPGRRPRGQFIAGTSLAAAGLAGLAAGYALLAPRARAAEDWTAAVDGGAEGRSSQQQWIDLRGYILATSSFGALSLTAAMPLVLPNRAKTPWWAWLSGGVGVGLAAFSVAYGLTAPAEPDASCTQATLDPDVPRGCIEHSERTTLALLTGLTAAPLITMPLVYLFRNVRRPVEPTIHIGRTRATVRFRMEF